MRRFPTAGSYVFWLIWPAIVAHLTAKMYKRHVGRDIPKERIRKLRKDLAGITGPIMKPVSTPAKE